ncbi:transglutaminase-like domain-containing protein [Lysinibacillus telephonicus]|uniref:transglutaminase-like domain-containing protein n=1 Tax=Lysinibacillus telephonicus TaxID=1714840 RepID=UPI00397C858C
MNLIAESIELGDYLNELPVVDFSHESIKQKTTMLFSDEQDDVEKVRIAYEYVRDEISQSLDIESQYVPCKASDVLIYGEGVCFAKANLLAAILRSQTIPTGFCYQRLLIHGNNQNGYALHALNAVFYSISKSLDSPGCSRESERCYWGVFNRRGNFTI